MKKAMHQPLLWLILLLSIGVTSSAQLLVNTSASGSDLANALIGSGVTISNVNLDCGPNASGLFTGGNTTNVGIDQGVLLTTGLATDAIGPNSAGNTSFDHSSTYHGDADLQTISAFPLNDACSLSFDFTSQSSLITIQYSFASEEYNEYVCSVYNDLFAFFVTGPNPMGGQYTNQNVALIPGTNLPVAINAVNNGSQGSQSSGNCTSLDYSSFYVNNVGGTSIEYDGFTVVFTAEIPITPGEDYTFKFVIADVSDGVLDSGVFIKGESFSVFACQAGTISFENASSPLILCADDDQISQVNVTTNSLIEGDTYTFLLTSLSGEILEINPTGDFFPESYGLSGYNVYGLSYSGIFELPEVGDNISDFSVDDDFGCFELSQPLSIVVQNCIPDCSLEVICPNNQGGNFQCISDVPFGSAGDVIIVDSCNEAEIFIDYEEDGNGCINDVYNRQIMYTIIDGDVTTTCTVNHTAVDDVAPVILTQIADETISCGAELPVIDVLAEDNCSDVVVEEKATVIEFEFEDCEGFRSQTPGGWGSPANGENPGTYRDANFSAAFPNGLMIGCDNTLLLTSAEEIEEFLPAGGQPAVLPNGNLVDVELSNSFASHLVAITLSLGFDAYDPNFGTSNYQAENLIFNNGLFTGMSVGEVVAIANSVIGGCSSEYTPEQLKSGLALFNENYVDGIEDNGNFSCQGNENECEYTVFRCWIATDACGNTATVSQTITVTDNESPVSLTDVPAEITVECFDDVPSYDVVFTDNCDELLELSAISSIGIDGCTQIISRSWSATDDCGNVGTVSQVVYIVDTQAPVFTNHPENVVITCLDEVPDAPAVSAEDACSDFEITFVETISDGECPIVITRTWTAIDECGNEDSIEQTVTIVDNEAPVFEPFTYLISVSCELVDGLTVSAADNCSDVEITFTEYHLSGGCYGYSLRTWIATDACGNVATAEQLIQITDWIAPVISGVGEDMVVECDNVPSVPEVVASDNCSEATLDFNEVIIPGDCPGYYTIIWTWTSVDFCDNVATEQQIIDVVDTTGPVFTYIAASATIECGMDVLESGAEATDACSTASVSMVETTEAGDCPQESTITRTYTATDACGNTTVATQVINIVDTSAPILFGTPSEILVLNCDDTIPAPAEVTVSDNCDQGVEIIYTETYGGDIPAEGSTADCLALTPAGYANGEVCTGAQPWSVVLFGFEGVNNTYYSTIEANWVEYPDGTATLTGSVVSLLNTNEGWNISVAFESGMDWTGWSNQAFPTGYKDDCGLSGDNHLDWMYYIMTAGAQLTGWGDLAGTTLDLHHAPSNYFYGYQVGVAANNVNENYGGGGWFTYTGNHNGQNINGSGNFAFDHDCCPRYTLTRTWSASDCAGNAVSFSQTISFDSSVPPTPIIGIEDSCPEDFSGNGVIGAEDMLLILSELGCNGNCGCDLNGDGYVNSGDLIGFLSALGTFCY